MCLGFGCWIGVWAMVCCLSGLVCGVGRFGFGFWLWSDDGGGWISGVGWLAVLWLVGFAWVCPFPVGLV